MTMERALRLRAAIEKASASLADTEALDAVELFPQWKASGAYAQGDRVRWLGLLWKCLMAHSAQPNWTPDSAPSLWSRVLIPDPASIPEWVQPDSTNPYQKGDKVRHNGSVWSSDLDGNIWEPGIYGWTRVI